MPNILKEEKKHITNFILSHDCAHCEFIILSSNNDKTKGTSCRAPATFDFFCTTHDKTLWSFYDIQIMLRQATADWNYLPSLSCNTTLMVSPSDNSWITSPSCLFLSFIASVTINIIFNLILLLLSRCTNILYLFQMTQNVTIKVDKQ